MPNSEYVSREAKMTWNNSLSARDMWGGPIFTVLAGILGEGTVVMFCEYPPFSQCELKYDQTVEFSEGNGK